MVFKLAWTITLACKVKWVLLGFLWETIIVLFFLVIMEFILSAQRKWSFPQILIQVSPSIPLLCYTFCCTTTPPLFLSHSVIDFTSSSFSILAFLGLTTQWLFFIEPGKALEQWIILNMINPTSNPAMRLQQGSTCNSKPYYRATNASWGWRITAQPAAV